MKKRTFLKVSSIAAAGSLILPLGSCSGEEKPVDKPAAMAKATVFELPKLAFAFSALAPNIDEQTMKIHHGKHHAGYVRKFNAALKGNKLLADKSIESMMSMIQPGDTALRNNGGGHYNHSLFWQMLSPTKQTPKGDLLSAVNSTFGSLDNFKSQFSKAATGRFGSGWAWLCIDENKALSIQSTPNQDNPLMSNIVKKSAYPLLGLDVWEHAYYLHYQNRRGDYVNNFFNVINWDAVASRFSSYMKG